MSTVELLPLVVDSSLQLSYDLMDRCTVRQLSVLTNRRLKDGRYLAAFADVVLLSGLSHDESHAPHPSVRFVLLGHALRVLTDIALHHHGSRVAQLQSSRL